MNNIFLVWMKCIKNIQKKIINDLLKNNEMLIAIKGGCNNGIFKERKTII